MAFFTTLLQRQVNDVWRRKIQQADAKMRLYKFGATIWIQLAHSAYIIIR